MNRKYFVQQNAIKKIKSYPKSKLRLELKPAISEDIIISQEDVAAFKEWMGQIKNPTLCFTSAIGPWINYH